MNKLSTTGVHTLDSNMAPMAPPSINMNVSSIAPDGVKKGITQSVGAMSGDMSKKMMGQTMKAPAIKSPSMPKMSAALVNDIVDRIMSKIAGDDSALTNPIQAGDKINVKPKVIKPLVTNDISTKLSSLAWTILNR